MFTTNASNVFETVSDENKEPLEPNSEDSLINSYELEKCLEWIVSNKYERTCLQFPQELLNDGTRIALYLQKNLGKVVYILGDTSYGSCCVDEVGASHVNADSIIHFGHACLSPVIKLPVFYVFSKLNLNLKRLIDNFQRYLSNKTVIVFYDNGFYHLYNDLCNLFKGKKNVFISRLKINKTILKKNTEILMYGRIFNSELNSNVSAVYIGKDSVTLQNLVLSLAGFKWYTYDNDELQEYVIHKSKFFNQRTYLVEKIKEANTIGILIGTLGVKNYLDGIERIKKLAKIKGKKCYKIAIGKPSVEKLANFPEIDVFALISCPENPLLKNCKDYYKPIVSLFEIETALGNRPFSQEYTSDFREILPGGSLYIRKNVNSEPKDNESGEPSVEVIKKSNGTLIESTGTQFLLSRTWCGLDQNLTETEVCKAAQGRSGIPQNYEDELSTISDKKESRKS